MFKTRFAISWMMALSLLLLGTVAAQDSGQYLILSAQYGNERNHVDVTNRLKELARRDRRFRISDESMAVDPDRGHAKMLRVFARGPNGRERMFDFPDGSVFDGAQFRSWGRGDWGDDHWNGGWNGRNDNDAGEYLILTAQYGNEYRHVDVTNRLKEMARTDRQFRLDFRTFAVDPDEGHAKVLRIYARGPNRRERIFAPFASRFPFEMGVFPKSHSSAFSWISPGQIESLARILRDVLQKLDHTLGGPPYNLSLQDRPFLRPREGYWNTIEDDFHWHLQILPQIVRVTGFEWASWFFYNPVPPEIAAQCLSP